MYAKLSSVGFPDDVEVEEIELKAILRASEPKWEDARDVEITRAEFDKLLEAWKNFEGPVKDVNHFQVAVEVEEGIYATATYDQGRVEVEVRPEEEIDRDLVRQVPFSGQRIAARKVRPNEKCPCGSGKKFKKCCKGKM